MDNLTWGLQMTVLGMGLVFGLLALLWGLLTLVLRLDKAPAAPLSAALPPGPVPDSGAVVAPVPPASRHPRALVRAAQWRAWQAAGRTA